jgi:tartrate-resistant acid phosphatase type 5
MRMPLLRPDRMHMLKEAGNTFLATALLWFLVTSPAHAHAQSLFAIIGDYGSGSTNEADVASIVYGWQPEFIITTGDNRYGETDFDEVVGQFYCDYLSDAGSGVHCSGDNSQANAFFPSLGNMTTLMVGDWMST